MPAFSDEVTIAKPKDEVFTFAANMDHSTDVMPNVVKIEKLTEGPVGVGTQYRETREIRGKEASSVIEVVEYKPNEKYSVKSSLEGLTTIYHYTFTERDGETKIRFECEINASTLKMKLVKPVFKRIMKKEDGDHLQYMKKAIEQSNA
ncbi:SRPBCC family protein [Pontibacillus sp. HMF3514]|uniref:SRPBCC family protein n=1 Tax=Pontibacillus sp. HMF3514 TaxID=2692425 RepID=UPI0013204EEA|nr:SRPBCC family protein [Pontibacillus sp. HMF3514]QHE51064.1 hypothetical protein GS400_02960 [Pontibacillus sp. HMF3514]